MPSQGEISITDWKKPPKIKGMLMISKFLSKLKLIKFGIHDSKIWNRNVFVKYYIHVCYCP
jgi:hypothetical protein